jgi:hypothetical protein
MECDGMLWLEATHKVLHLIERGIGLAPSHDHNRSPWTNLRYAFGQITSRNSADSGNSLDIYLLAIIKGYKVESPLEADFGLRIGFQFT